MIKNLQIVSVLLLPLYFIFPTGESIHTICPFFHLTGIPCPGCGMGRSLVHIFHLELEHSLKYHPFGVVIAISQIFLIMSIFFPFLIQIIRKNKLITFFQYSFAIIFISFGLVRIYSFATNNQTLAPYFYDFNKTFSIIRWILSQS